MPAYLRALLPSYPGPEQEPGWRPTCVANARRNFASYIQGSLPLALIAFGIFLLSRPYYGVVQDAYIYIGRALADLDPDGVGRDLMFVHDGQFGFSIFRPIAAVLVAHWGPAFAAKGLALAAMAAWFSAAAAFSRQLIGGGAVWALLVFAALLSASYGAPYLFGFAEPLAIPRPFSEALVLAGLAALARGRKGLSLCWLIAAGLMHPIMSLAGFGVYLVMLSTECKRLLFFYVLAFAGLILGGALGLPFLGRLFLTLDPSARDLCESNHPFIFPSHWPAESIPPLLVQVATVAIAAGLQCGRVRSILSAVALAALLGIVVAVVFGDWLSSLLILQLQPWRAAWLLSAVGTVALGFCAIKLWPRGASGRITLAFLVLAWSFGAQFEVAAIAAGLALYFHLSEKRFEPLLNSKFVTAAWMFTIAVSAIWQLRLFAFPWQFSMDSPAGYASPAFVAFKFLLPLPVCGLAAYCVIVKPRISHWRQTGIAVILIAAAAVSWDHRSPNQNSMETAHPPAGIEQLIGERKGEILWIDGSAEAWFVLGRPQWATPLQGIPIIFSSALASQWRKRTQVLMELSLADQKSFARWSERERTDRPQLSREGVQLLCAREDAPAWIIAPLEHGAPPPAGIPMTLWELPEPQFRVIKYDGSYIWEKIDAYGIIPCTGRQSP